MGVLIKNNCNCNQAPKKANTEQSNSLKGNNLQYIQQDSTTDAEDQQGYRIHQNCPLTSIKRHAGSAHSDGNTCTFGSSHRH